jgi:hypothetical protein
MRVVADIQPEARDSGDIRPARIHRQSQHLAVKLPSLFQLFRGLADANAVMV